MTNIGGEWYLNNMCNPKHPTRKPRLIKKQKKEEYKLKGKLKFACDHWKDWRFQINWKQLEFIMTLQRNTKKNLFCMSSNRFFLKDVIQDNHWVGH